MIELTRLNEVSVDEFAGDLTGIFEHSPWVAQRAALRRPFTSRLHLLDSLRAVVDEATPAEQLTLIRAHPQLGSKGRNQPDLTAASAREQRRAGLQACTDEDFARLDALNAAYVEKFAMPFILAVRGHDPGSIIASGESRLAHDHAQELLRALREIGLIAGYRLAGAVAAPVGVEVIAMHERLAGLGPIVAAGTAAASVREWMLAADLEVTVDERGQTLGRRRGVAAVPSTRCLGVLGITGDTSVRQEGSIRFLLAIELMNSIHHRGIRLADDLTVVMQNAGAADSRGAPPSGMADGMPLDSLVLQRAARDWESVLLKNHEVL